MFALHGNHHSSFSTTKLDGGKEADCEGPTTTLHCICIWFEAQYVIGLLNYKFVML